MSGHRFRRRVVRRLRLAATALTLAVLISSPAALRAEGASSPSAASSWRDVRFQGVSVTVPGGWPVYDLGRVSRCARQDVHAVYLGHQGTTGMGCPARLAGKSEAVHIEPLDASVAAVSAFATQAAVVNDQQVRLDPAAGVTHSIEVAIDQVEVLMTITFRADRGLATRVLNSLIVSPGPSHPPARPTSSAPTAEGGLPEGSLLQPGQSVRSPTMQHELRMQGDGNLVLYAQGRASWASWTQGNAGAFAAMQGDGNLVVYAGMPARALWASNTQGNSGAALDVQNDGNAVVHDQGRVLWATNTVDSSLFPGQSLSASWFLVSTSEEFTFVMQGDGNLVLYDAGEPLWSSGTQGNPGAVVLMQGDGNLVVYGGTPSRPLWSSGTWGTPGSRLIVQGDGNVVIYGPSRAVWATWTTSHVFDGLGFDTCAAPAASSMNAWLASPFRAVGIFLGGANRACPDGNLSASWVTAVAGQGWSFAPLYVGLQAPCNSGFASIDPNNASSQGSQAADDAVARARGFGISMGTPIFFDMEAYSPTGGACSSAVMTFLAAWAGELRVHGVKAGVYSSLDSGIADLVRTPAAQPDELWFAKWDGSATTSDPAIPSTLWSRGLRLKQYQGGHTEMYGGVTINIDRDYLDALVR
jgi:hypothetical protein